MENTAAGVCWRTRKERFTSAKGRGNHEFRPERVRPKKHPAEEPSEKKKQVLAFVWGKRVNGHPHNRKKTVKNGSDASTAKGVRKGGEEKKSRQTSSAETREKEYLYLTSKVVRREEASCLFSKRNDPACLSKDRIWAILLGPSRGREEGKRASTTTCRRGQQSTARIFWGREGKGKDPKVADL